MTGLHMLRLPLDLRQLYALGREHGHVAPRSDPRHAVDPGYLAHAALKALFAEAAPKPFTFVAEPATTSPRTSRTMAPACRRAASRRTSSPMHPN